MIGEQIDPLQIVDMSVEGFGIGRLPDGQVVFVENGIPGDVVKTVIKRKRKGVLYASVVELLESSKSRVEPFCQHFSSCGGCRLQNVDYGGQIAIKENWVKQTLSRISGMRLPEVRPIIGSKETTYYRNKLEFTFSNKRWWEEPGKIQEDDTGALGFHVPRFYDKILDIKTCYLQSDYSDSIRNELRGFALAKNISFYDLKAHKGSLRNLIIRSTSLEEHMVIVQFGYPDGDDVDVIMQFLLSRYPQITSLNYIVNQKRNETYLDQDVITYAGKPYITECFEGIEFRISPKSFFQTNSTQALELYRMVRKLAELKKDQVVYDLYTGTGTIAQFIARDCMQVVGIEYVEDAVSDARRNAERNKISNTSFYAGDMAELLTKDFVEENGYPELIITDPPRAGMHPKVVNQLMEILPKSIIYVSCNPSTQARDLGLMAEKYTVDYIQPIDMFPHTMHVENVIRLKRK